MVKYICARCGYKTHHKSVFRKHLNRKRVCSAVIIDIPIDVLRESFKNNTYLDNYCNDDISNEGSLVKYEKKAEFVDNHIESEKKYIVEEPDGEFVEGGIYMCSFCDTAFQRKFNCNRHQKNCKHRIDRSNKIEELQNKIDKLEKLLDTRTNIVGNNNTIIDKQQNNIIINNYKSENTDYITNKVLEKILTMGPYLALPRLIKYVHFNKRHPENHNLAITNIHSKFAHIRTNNMWQVRILNELLEELVSSKFNILDEYFETEGREKIPTHKANSYEIFRDRVSEDESTREQLKTKLYETIVNFSKELGIVKNV